MTAQTTIIARDVFNSVDLPFAKGNIGYFSQNAVVRHLVDYLGDNEYDSAEDLVRDLEMAHWAAGSFGLIYDSELSEFLDCPGRRTDVEDIIEAYTDHTGEEPEFKRFADLLIFAIDFASGEIAAAIEYKLDNAAAA